MDKVVSEVDGKKSKAKKKTVDDAGDDEKLDDDYLNNSGISDSEFVVPLKDLKPQHKLSRIMYLWRKAYKRAKGGGRIKNIFSGLHRKVLRHGSTRNLLSE